IWQQGGRDIFTTIDGQNCFALKDNYIVATDWENNKYKFDYDGHIINANLFCAVMHAIYNLFCILRPQTRRGRL
ncbi:MAG: hypothetical protein LBV75_03945, partial [Paludibacter sp.]|nr:hypothetical protein [Paludibacter sp.]